MLHGLSVRSIHRLIVAEPRIDDRPPKTPRPGHEIHRLIVAEPRIDGSRGVQPPDIAYPIIARRGSDGVTFPDADD